MASGAIEFAITLQLVSDNCELPENNTDFEAAGSRASMQALAAELNALLIE